MIITEGIGVIKILLVAYVVSSFMFDGIGQITNFDTSQLTTVAVLVVELVCLFGAHSWVRPPSTSRRERILTMHYPCL
jgi:hypothetical protein